MCVLCRHAEAIPRESGVAEEDRWLTQRGRQQMHKTARAYRKQSKERSIVGIFTSPLVRAVMTAEILAAELEIWGPVEVRRELALDRGPHELLGLFTKEHFGFLFVGHQPQLGEALRLCGLSSDGRFKKGTLVEIPEGR